MNILINRIAGEVTVDGVTRSVDLSALDATIDSITFNEASGTGLVNSDTYIGRQNFNQLYAKYLQAWKIIGAPERTLEEVKADQVIYMNSIRDSIEQGGFPFEVRGVIYTFDSNPIAAQRISMAALSARDALDSGTANSFSIDWTTADNQTVNLDANELVKMPTALATYSAVLHNIAATKKSQINSALTVADVLSITWD